jgi:hypothetical protein
MRNDSNQSLRFSRTAREEFGHDLHFDKPHVGDKLVGYATAFAWGFLICLIIVGGM